jgi:type VI secretion system protein ImpJ
MSDDQYLPDAVQWSEGMLLSPQHFQQHDIHTQALVQQRLLAAAPHCWGVTRLQVDQAHLAQGEVAVTEFQGVMPDGLPVVFSSLDGRAPDSLNVGPLCPPDGRPVRVWLAVPPRTGAMSVPSTSIKRYESLPGVATIDEVTGIGDVVVERGRVRLELYAGEQLPPGHPALCLLEVARDGQGVVALTAFHPPMTRLAASGFLGTQGLLQMIASLRERMWDKLHELAGTATDDAPEAAVVLGDEDQAQLNMARTVAACLPLVDTILADRLTAPGAAYQALAQVVGRMAAIGGNPRPLAMEPYRHEDCIGQFQAAFEFIGRKLRLAEAGWDNLAFSRLDDGVFARRLPDNTGQLIYIELRPRAGQAARDLQAWLSDALIASEDFLPTLRQRRLAGAQCRLLGAREADDLGLRTDAIIFELRSQRLELPQYGVVDSFRAGHTLLVHGRAPGAPAAIVLHHRKHARAAAQAGNGANAGHA